ncbi:hypothetical protein [Secundilactobacillus kimchicus]|uniref:hypothetical protein n=1 Tax=Secundilactobacillus kimchicus TaxID=528209 RepID=UPI0024A8AF77|nr:hypothetical protein [Secundilactobacillus kimchicus]
MFSKAPIDFQLADLTTVEIPLPDEQDSLSAISLDADCYSLLKQGIEISPYVNGPLLKTEYLILFKAKAQLDIARQMEANERVNHRDKMKHKKDIFDLLDTLEDSDFIPSDLVPDQVKRDLNDYIKWLEDQPSLGTEVAQRKLPRFGRSPIKSKQKVIDALSNLIR